MHRLFRAASPPIDSSALAARKIPSNLPSDIMAFLFHYPSRSSDRSASANLAFYQNRAAAHPRRLKVNELQDELRGNWGELEGRHDFIQWLFPIREQGVNSMAQPLELHEIEAIKTDPTAMERLMESYVLLSISNLAHRPRSSCIAANKRLPHFSNSYRIMLAFYGMRLVSETTGELTREESTPAPDSASFVRRYANLERNMHNFLRITRILKCMDEFGLARHPPSFLLFILAEQSTHGHLTSPALVRSMDNYWRWCVRDDKDRQFVVQKVDEVRRGGTWTENEYVRWVRKRAEET
ncbi:SPOSA6832_03744 [Sporobolomyces salmonicolor]|uniref:SPOSA6832_03744-mRNA-1:cds n=1 Tax=Sporidiobolus salmonicolor TaxID=5005 RepID=A0A0D6EQ89_SPOSA|nr:SPOSA6832_03744 [Sporobolomyces salmonicolor]